MHETARFGHDDRFWYRFEADGSIRNTSSTDAIPVRLRPILFELVEKAVASVQQTASIYLRGSVVRGTFVPGLSDIDMVMICGEALNQAEKDQLIRTVGQVTRSQLIGCELELMVVPVEKILRDKRFERLRFLLQIQGACLTGPDILCNLLKPVLSKSYYEVSYLETCIQSVIDALNTGNQHDSEVLCPWIMKILIRSGYEIIMERENRYTRDLPCCVDLFGEYYPARVSQMQAALRLAVKPIRYGTDIAFLCRSLGHFIIGQRTSCALPD